MTTHTVFKPDYARLIMPFISTEASRYYLCGFYVAPHRSGGVTITATDGHALAMFHDPDGFCKAPAIWCPDKATIKACKSERRDAARRWFTLTGEVSPDAGARKPHKLRIIVAETAAQAAEQADNDNLHQVVLAHTATTLPIDGTYPDQWRVIPSQVERSAKPCSFNSRLLAKFSKVAGENEDGSQSYSATLSVNAPDDSSPAVILTHRTDFFGVVMPCRAPNTPAGLGVYPAFAFGMPELAAAAE